MTNLEWIRTLSAKELSDLLYDYWLPRGQYVWTDSRKGLVKMLGETYLERDCDKCKHQGNCYCVKGFGCPFEPKTENSSEKPNNCETCRHYKLACELFSEICKYEPKDEPLTADYCDTCDHKECEYCIADGSNPYCVPSNYHKVEDESTISKMEQVEDEPQTDCAWKRGE